MNTTGCRWIAGRRGLPVVALALLCTGLWGQQLRIASYNMEHLGEGHKDYAALAKVVSAFDLVAAEEVMNREGMRAVLQQLGPGWSDCMSEAGEGSRRYQEYFGFFYDRQVELLRTLGEYPKARQFFRPPFGAQFRWRGSGLVFNLVACHIVYGKSQASRRAEIGHLGEVYRFFEGLTGNRGTTIVLGDFNEEAPRVFQNLVDAGEQEVVASEKTTVGSRGPDHAYDHVFLPLSLLRLEVGAGVDYWTRDFRESRRRVSDHFPVFVILGSGS